MKTLLATLALGASVAVAAPPTWTITTLPSLPSPKPFATAEAINNRGDIVGWSYIYDPAINSNRGYAVLWQGGRAIGLGEGSAFAINDRGTIAGSVVGGMSIMRDVAERQWIPVGGTLVAGAPFGINKSGAIAGWFVNGLPHAFLYRDGIAFDLGTLGGTDSAATALNDRGQVVGYANVTGDTNYHAFLYENGTMKDLGTLGGGRESRAHDINNHGVVVGEAWTASGNSRPFIYDGVMRQLFDSPECCIVPRALNDHGAVVGTIAGNASFLYEDGVLTRLESIPSVRAAGWVQLIPNDINDRGWIVGMGRKGTLAWTAQSVWEPFVLRR